MGVFFAGVGEKKKKVGLILKFKAHISKYVRHIFEGSESACLQAFGSGRIGVLGFNILRFVDYQNVNYPRVMHDNFHALHTFNFFCGRGASAVCVNRGLFLNVLCFLESKKKTCPT